MTPSRLGLLLLGTLALASCGQQSDGALSTPTPVAAPASPAPSVLSDAQISALRARIADLQALQADLRAGRAVAPLDDAGAAIDLDALLRDMQADLQRGLQPQGLPDGGQGGLGAQVAPYPSSTYLSIAATDTFRGRYTTLRNSYPRFNWATDGCSGPAGYTGWSDEFYWPCRQHDFGYRNARFYPSLMNESHRHWVDAQFKDHMQNVCDTLGWRKYACYVAAQAFYSAVYLRGGSSFY